MKDLTKLKIFFLILCIWIVGIVSYAVALVCQNNIIPQTVQVNTKYLEMLNVVVRLKSPSNIGSGVLIYRQHLKQDSMYVYYIITNEHITSNRITTDLQVDGIRGTHQIILVDPGIVVRVFNNSATEWQEYHGEIVVESPVSDLSLVTFQTDDYLPHIAKIISIEALDKVEIFDEIYALGCQLGYPVMPTRGIIAGFVEYDDLTILFHTAHTLPGSSGGGLFKKDDGQYYLIGLPQGVRRYNSHIMPHYGYAISAEIIYRFLHEHDMSFIYENGIVNEVQHAG